MHFARYSPDGNTHRYDGANGLTDHGRFTGSLPRVALLHELNVPIASQADPNWMPDNQSILFGQPPRYFAEPDTPRAIYIHNLQTNSISKVPGSEGWFSPRISPDGRGFWHSPSTSTSSRCMTLPPHGGGFCLRTRRSKLVSPILVAGWEMGLCELELRQKRLRHAHPGPGRRRRAGSVLR